jgi:Holliday junction DNA helicase RuvB
MKFTAWGKVVEEILYPAMEDFALDLVIGQGPGARTAALEPAALHGDWRHDPPALLSAPLRTRFGAVYRVDFYEQARWRILWSAPRARSRFPMAPEGRDEICARGRGTPACALRLLRRVRDYAQGAGMASSLPASPPRRYPFWKLTPWGWDDLDRRVLAPSSRNSTEDRLGWRRLPPPSARLRHDYGCCGAVSNCSWAH